MYKVEAVVNSSRENALVLDRNIKLNYTKHDGLIVGVDDENIFVRCLIYKEVEQSKSSYIDYELEIPLTNGEVFRCDSHWYHGGYEEAEKVLGFKTKEVLVASMESMLDFGLFFVYNANIGKIDELANSYKGKVYEHTEYIDFIDGAKLL